jgi:hypothetical protein
MITTISKDEIYGKPQKMEGVRSTFPVCFNYICVKLKHGERYYHQGERGVIINTKENDCIHCGDALFWVSKRNKQKGA